jgi:hypothetical protein
MGPSNKNNYNKKKFKDKIANIANSIYFYM